MRSLREEGVGGVARFLPAAVRAARWSARLGLRLHRRAAWGEHPGTLLCACGGAVPQQAPALEFFTELLSGIIPDKSVQQ